METVELIAFGVLMLVAAAAQFVAMFAACTAIVYFFFWREFRQVEKSVLEEIAVPSAEEIERKIHNEAAKVVSAQPQFQTVNLVWSEPCQRYKYRCEAVWREVIADIYEQIEERKQRRGRIVEGGFWYAMSTAERSEFDRLNKEIDDLFELLNAATRRGYATSYDHQPRGVSQLN